MQMFDTLLYVYVCVGAIFPGVYIFLASVAPAICLLHPRIDTSRHLGFPSLRVVCDPQWRSRLHGGTRFKGVANTQGTWYMITPDAASCMFLLCIFACLNDWSNTPKNNLQACGCNWCCALQVFPVVTP